jgi:PHD/YefM family antitoxin component YafN of YafNO toxin-antitoxin module
LPSGIPGRGEVMEGAMQQAAQCGRQIMSHYRILNTVPANYANCCDSIRVLTRARNCSIVLLRVSFSVLKTNHLKRCNMSSLTANDLKTKGVAAIEAVLAERPEAIVSVRGKDRFVVMDIAQYNHLRECELEAALAETRADVAAGRVVKESAAAHVKRVKKIAA